MDNHLAYSSKGTCNHGQVLTYLHAQLIKLDKKEYLLSAFAIMPNYMHLLLKLLITLPLIM